MKTDLHVIRNDMSVENFPVRECMKTKSTEIFIPTMLLGSKSYNVLELVHLLFKWRHICKEHAFEQGCTHQAFAKSAQPIPKKTALQDDRFLILSVLRPDRFARPYADGSLHRERRTDFCAGVGDTCAGTRSTLCRVQILPTAVGSYGQSVEKTQRRFWWLLLWQRNICV